jgi:hypothetical protein
MADKVMARVIHMHDTEENWNKCETFIPAKSEIIVYDIDSTHTYPRFKIGDGVTSVVNLEFSVDSILNELFVTRDGIKYIDSGYIG